MSLIDSSTYSVDSLRSLRPRKLRSLTPSSRVPRPFVSRTYTRSHPLRFTHRRPSGPTPYFRWSTSGPFVPLIGWTKRALPSQRTLAPVSHVFSPLSELVLDIPSVQCQRSLPGHTRGFRVFSEGLEKYCDLREKDGFLLHRPSNPQTRLWRRPNP